MPIFICCKWITLLYLCLLHMYRLPMAKLVKYETPCLLGSLGVREIVGSRPGRGKVRRVFHPTRKLIRFSLLKCPSIPNSEMCSPRGTTYMEV